jgi:D-lactate dehydrogenase (cytochrome)
MDEFLHPPGSRRRSRTTEEVNAQIVVYTLARGGTSTGEHGVGFGKNEAPRNRTRRLSAVHGGIKKLADPYGIMNPGKVLAADEREVPEKSC